MRNLHICCYSGHLTVLSAVVTALLHSGSNWLVFVFMETVAFSVIYIFFYLPLTYCFL